MTPFDPWLERWSLTVDGTPIRTGYADLLPVLREGAPAMLKIARTPEERRGAALLDWYGGRGASLPSSAQRINVAAIATFRCG
jgi:streptomycin 6-kinase